MYPGSLPLIFTGSVPGHEKLFNVLWITPSKTLLAHLKWVHSLYCVYCVTICLPFFCNSFSREVTVISQFDKASAID